MNSSSIRWEQPSSPSPRLLSRELGKLDVGEAKDWIGDLERFLTAKAADAETKRVDAAITRKRADLVECELSDEVRVR